MDIFTYEQLRIEAQNALKEAISRTSERVSKILADQIDRDVYKSHGANSWYHDFTSVPTYEFRDKAWEWSPAVMGAIGDVVSELAYKPNNIEFDEGTWKHGSPIKGWGDAREYLANILNQEGKKSSLSMTVDRPSDARFWDNFLKQMFDNKVIEKILKQEIVNLKIGKLVK